MKITKNTILLIIFVIILFIFGGLYFYSLQPARNVDSILKKDISEITLTPIYNYNSAEDNVLNKWELTNSDVEFAWSPRDSAVFAERSKYDPKIIMVFRITGPEIEVVSSFEGSYSRFEWSKTGKYLIALANAGRYETFPITVTSLNIDDQVVRALSKPINATCCTLQEISPCKFEYTYGFDYKKKGEVATVSIPECEVNDYLSEIPKSEIIVKREKVQEYPHEQYRVDFWQKETNNREPFFSVTLDPNEEGFSASPNGNFYIRKDAIYQNNGKRLYDFPFTEDFTWGPDDRYLTYATINESSCDKLGNCRGELFLKEVATGRDIKLSVKDHPQLRNPQQPSFSKNYKYIKFVVDAESNTESSSAYQIRYIATINEKL